MFQRSSDEYSSTKWLLYCLVFVRALHLIANLLKEENIFASLTSSTIAIALCPMFVVASLLAGQPKRPLVSVAVFDFRVFNEPNRPAHRFR